MKTYRWVVHFFLVVSAILVVACGGADDESESSSPQQEVRAVEVATMGRGELKELAASPVSAAVVVTASEGIWVYDLATGDEQRLSYGSFELAVFSADGSMVAATNDQHQIKVWSVTGEAVATIRILAPLDRLAFAADGQLLLTHQAGLNLSLVKGWSIADADLVFEVEDAMSFATSPHTDTIVVGMMDGTLAWVNAQTSEIQQRQSGHSAVVTAVAFAPDGSTVLTGSDDQTARLWDAETGETIRIFEGDSKLTEVAYAPNAQTILTTHVLRGRVSQVWELETGAPVQVFETAVQYMPDSQTVYGESNIGELGIWDIATGELIQEFVDDADGITHQVVVSDGQTVVSAMVPEGVVIQWEVATGEMLRVFDGFFYANAMFAPDGQRLLCWQMGTESQNFVLWDIETQSEVREFSTDRPLGGNYQQGIGYTTAFSRDGRWLAASTADGMIWVWDVETGEVVDHLEDDALRRLVRYLAFSPDEPMMIVASSGLIGVIWDLDTGMVVERFGGPSDESEVRGTAVNWKSGVQIMFLEGDRLRVWTPNASVPLEMDFDRDSHYFHQFAFHMAYIVGSDGHTVVSPTVDLASQTITEWRIWDAVSNDTLGTIVVEDGAYPYDVAISNDSRYLLINSLTNQIIVVDIRTAEIVQRISVEGLTDMVWSADAYTVIAASYEGLWMFDALSGEELWSTDLPNGDLRQVSLSPNGDYFITTEAEGLVQHGIVHVFALKEG